MKIVPAVTWKNCNAAIRTVRLETRWIGKTGGLVASEEVTIKADVVHKPNGRQSYTNPMNFYFQVVGDFVDYQTDVVYKTCTQRAGGQSNSDLDGATFYNVAQAFDKHGRKILEKISPPVVCDRNG